MNPNLSLAERRDNLIMRYLTGDRQLDQDFFDEYRLIHEEAGVEVGQSVIEHMQPYAAKLTGG